MMTWIRTLLARLGLARKRHEPDALEQLATMLEGQQQALLAARASVADTVRARKQADDQARGMADAATRLEQQARQALRAGDEDRARALLVQCEASEQHQAALAPDVQRLAEAEQRLLATVRDTESRIELLRTRQRSLQGARDSATAQAQLAQLRGELDAGTSQIGATMAQAEEDAMRAELHAAALRELEQSTAPAELPTDTPAQLMPGVGDVLRAGLDERLTRLKEEVAVFSGSQGASTAQQHAAAQPPPAETVGPPAPDIPPGPPAPPARDPLRTRMPPPPPPVED